MTLQAGAESRTTHHGFLNGDGTHFYRYDAWGRLTEVRAAASGAVIRTHVYDCEGRRVLETETNGGAPVTTRYVFWGAGLAASYNVAGGNTRTYGFVGGADGEAFVRVQQSGADNFFELARDFQGTILALIQRTNPASVSVVERYRYEPFGKVAIENASGQPLPQSGFGNDRFFLGRVWDAEVGLYDVRARWYEPDLGAFLAPDPLGAVDSWNFYQYGLAEPNSVLDPFGLQAVGTGAGTSAAERIEAIDARIAELYEERHRLSLVAQLPVVGPDCDLGGWIEAELQELYEERDALTRTTAPPASGPNDSSPGGGSGGDDEDWMDFAYKGFVFMYGATWPEWLVNIHPAGKVANKAWNGLGRLGRVLRGSGRSVEAALDATGKVHGKLPLPQDLGQYAADDLQRLRDELTQSVKARIEATVELGADFKHSDRIAQEQQLIKSIESHLRDR